jgi:RND family efflux transporter MFP subunit
VTQKEDSIHTRTSDSAPPADLSRLRINRPSTFPDSGVSVRRIGWKCSAGIGAALFFVGVLFGRLFLSNAETPEGKVQGDPPHTQVPTAEGPSARALSEGLSAPRASGLAASGYVVAQRQAAVASQATGRLKELRVEEGDRVKAGDIIGVIENEGLQAAVRQEEASLRSAGARIASAQAGLAEISLQRRRIFDLFERKSVSQSEKDAVTASYERARAALAAAEADTELARARLDRAKVELGYSYIIAPFDGTVLTKNADEGEIVAPFGSSANARAAVVTIADMSSLEVEADVSESNLQRIVVGQDCSITLDSIPGKTYEGVVSNIVPTVDRAKATVLVKIKFKQLDERVIPEMSARVTLIDRK